MKILLMTEDELDVIWQKLQPQQRFNCGLSCPHVWLPMRNTLVLAKRELEILDHKIEDIQNFTLKEFYRFLTPEG